MFAQKMTKRYSLLILSTLLLTACNSTVTNKPTATIDRAPSSSFSTLSSEEKKTLNALKVDQKKLLEAINKIRSEPHTCGEKGTFPAVAPLTWNANLYKSALEHVHDLSQSNTFSHDGSGTQYDITGVQKGRPSKFYERIIANGYSQYYSVGENIAGGQRNLEEVMNAWMESPGHCVNIMKNTYTQVGVAIVIKEDSNYQVYWGQNFGSKRI